jgi:transcriptional regulator with XRE-family HTH domain
MFGELVATYRRRLGMTQEELAQRSGLGVRTIGALERSRKRVPRLASVQMLADAFGLNGDERSRFQHHASEAARRRPGSATCTAGSPVAAAQPPAQLPAPLGTFTGRTCELASLDGLLNGSPAQPGEPVAAVAAITGVEGSGKTALAVHWAHRVRDQFPDGQLFLGLRGRGPAPTRPDDVLFRALAALGVPREDVPREIDDRGARYRTELAHRRLLVVLDDAATGDQVEPLLPGAGRSVVLITSRDPLVRLVARYAVLSLEVPV